MANIDELPLSAVCTAAMYSWDGHLMCRAGNRYELVPAPEPGAEGYFDIVRCEGGNHGWCNAISIAEHFAGAPM